MERRIGDRTLVNLFGKHIFNTDKLEDMPIEMKMVIISVFIEFVESLQNNVNDTSN